MFHCDSFAIEILIVALQTFREQVKWYRSHQNMRMEQSVATLRNQLKTNLHIVTKLIRKTIVKSHNTRTFQSNK